MTTDKGPRFVAAPEKIETFRDLLDYLDALNELKIGEPSDLDQALAELIEACLTQAGKGTLTFTVSITPRFISEGVEESLTVGYKVATKPPEKKTRSAYLYADKDRALSDTNPYQPEPLFNTADFGPGLKEIKVAIDDDGVA